MNRLPVPWRRSDSRPPAPVVRAPGKMVAGSFLLVRELGHSGMGEVWEARQEQLDRPVAIKLLVREVRGMAERLLREARLLARIRHPGIVEVYDCGLLPDGVAYLVMERLRGETLAEALAQGPLPAVTAVPLFLAVLDALAAAHRAGVIHRDLKPDNIFLVPRATGGHAPKLLDFGVAIVGDELDGKGGDAGKLRGTPAYQAPGQLRGERADERSDVFAASATLYHALAGVPPFGGQSAAEVLARALAGPPPPLADTGPDLDGELDALLARGLGARPEDRFASVDEMRSELAAWQRLHWDESLAELLAQLALEAAAERAEPPGEGAPARETLEDLPVVGGPAAE
jgi:serine/threonine protein kinase